MSVYEDKEGTTVQEVAVQLLELHDETPKQSGSTQSIKLSPSLSKLSEQEDSEPYSHEAKLLHCESRQSILSSASLSKLSYLILCFSLLL